MTGKPLQKKKVELPNSVMKISPEGRARLRATEKDVYRYYNDMGKNRGHCTWGVGRNHNHAPMMQIALCKLQRLLAVAAIVLAFGPALATDDRYERAVTGKWRLTAALDGAEITALDEREAQQLVGRVFVIDKSKVQFGAHDCGPTEFEATRVEPRLFLRVNFRASSQRLGLPNPVTAVDLSCTTVFIKSPTRLVIAWDGWFFDAVRVKR